MIREIFDISFILILLIFVFYLGFSLGFSLGVKNGKEHTLRESGKKIRELFESKRWDR